MLAYVAAQYCDVQLFHFWKRVTRGKHLWLRNNLSTLMSQMVDSVMVVTVTFGAAFLRDEMTLVLEVWAMDRRSEQLEDRVGLELAEQEEDAQLALDFLFGDLSNSSIADERVDTRYFHQNLSGCFAYRIQHRQIHAYKRHVSITAKFLLQDRDGRA